MYYQIRPVYPNELMHSGVKGQKWGVRRYQNSDGTLTEAGKRRYNRSYRKKIDDAVEKRMKTETNMTKRSAALAEIQDMSMRNVIKTMAGMYGGVIGGAAASAGAAAAAAALSSAGMLAVSAAAPVVGAGITVASIANGIRKAVLLSEAENYYKYQKDKDVKTVNVT